MIKSIFGKKGKRGKSAQIINKVISGVDPDSIKKNSDKEDEFERFDECQEDNSNEVLS